MDKYSDGGVEWGPPIVLSKGYRGGYKGGGVGRSPPELAERTRYDSSREDEPVARVAEGHRHPAALWTRVVVALPSPQAVFVVHVATVGHRDLVVVHVLEADTALRVVFDKDDVLRAHRMHRHVLIVARALALGRRAGAAILHHTLMLLTQIATGHHVTPRSLAHHSSLRRRRAPQVHHLQPLHSLSLVL